MATVQDLQNLRDVLVCGVVGGALSEAIGVAGGRLAELVTDRFGYNNTLSAIK